MPTVAAFLPRVALFRQPRPIPRPTFLPSLPALAVRRRFLQLPLSRPEIPSTPRSLVLVAAASGASFDEQGRSQGRSFKKSILFNMVQEIEPLDVSLIQKDAPPNTVDAMKRTISGMLGLLPSDQFNVLVEALWEPLFKLLISSMKTGYTCVTRIHAAIYLSLAACNLKLLSYFAKPAVTAILLKVNYIDYVNMNYYASISSSKSLQKSVLFYSDFVFVEPAKYILMLGLSVTQSATSYDVYDFIESRKRYTLRSAEYRLYLERNLDIPEEHTEKGTKDAVEDNKLEMLYGRSPSMSNSRKKTDALCNHEKKDEVSGENTVLSGLGELMPEVQEYICYLQSRLNSAEKEIHDIRRSNSALQMQQFVGEEENDLLDYLRSLQPEKVAELSEPTCPGVEETIHSVVHGLLATLSPKMHSTPPHRSGNSTGGTLGVGEDDCAELVGNTSIQFQPLISVPRDYLARLLFWCMLLGHHIRGLEYRLELIELLTDSTEAATTLQEGDSVV